MRNDELLRVGLVLIVYVSSKWLGRPRGESEARALAEAMVWMCLISV